MNLTRMENYFVKRIDEGKVWIDSDLKSSSTVREVSKKFKSKELEDTKF